MRVGEAVIRLLEAHRVEVVFGIPGVHTIELYRGLDGSPIHAVTARSEAGAGFMADGYARVTGKPGVCILISGPGVTNAATPMGEAFHDSIPLLVVAGAIQRPDLGRGHGQLHDLPDQAGLVAGITALSRVVQTADELPALFDQAWRIFEAGRPRPVHIAIPTDLMEEPVADDLVFSRTMDGGKVVRPGPDPGAVERAAELLAGASCPAILLGGGAVDAGPEAIALAELLDAPVAVTGNARGVVPSSHPLCLNSTLALPSVQALFAQADAVLLVGTELSPVDSWDERRLHIPFGGPVVRIDIDPDQLERKLSPAVAIWSDAAPALAALTTAVAGRRREAGRGVERVRAALAAIVWPAQTEGHRPFLDAIDTALPEDRIVAVDSTQLGYSAHQVMPAHRPRSWLAPYGYGTLGPALPLAIGAKIAAPDRPVLAIVGDGGLLFTIGELATAADLGAPLPIVVWDNRGYGEIRDSFDRAGATRIGTETTAHDLLTIARGFGCLAVEATTPDRLHAEIQRALDAHGPTLIRVPDPAFRPAPGQ